ncbi:ABC transporter substrate-binding protein [Sodalis sp. RH14]|uniref:ABC transporter substrate-binding protein n=1 Tax=Sodalis sp. RH14 TaxID=3394329 RepID=UPI0039B51D6F
MTLKMFSGRVRAGGLLLALLLSLALAGGKALAAARDTLVIGQSADITSFDPTELRMGTFVLTHLLYNTLIRLDADGRPQPELARSWTRSDDGKTLTLKLADGVTFHDGRPFTARDVAFSLNYARDPVNGANILPLAKMIGSIDTPDDRTVILHFAGASDAIFDLLDLAFIIDGSAPKKIKTGGNGTGPFKLSRYLPGEDAVFVRNEAYWGPRPALKKITLKVIPDQQSGVMQLRAGTVDFLPSLDREAAEQLAAAGFATGAATVEGRVLDITLNTRTPPLDKPEVRRAIGLALDRARIAHDIAGPDARVKCLPWPHFSQREAAGHENACTFDLAQAKQLIQQAGAAGAEISLMSRSQSEPQIGAMAQMLQSALRDIGLKVNIVEMSEAAYISRLRKGDFQMAAHVYARAGRGPSTILMSAVIFRATDNLVGVKSQQYQDDVALVTSRPPDEQTDRAWQRIDSFMLEQNWVLPVATLPVLWASAKGLTGVRFNLDGMPILSAASFQP